MRVLCAWCREEGGPALLEEREPLNDERETYGICVAHRLEMRIVRYLRPLFAEPQP